MMEDNKYFAELNENMRMKTFVLQHILKDRMVDVTATETIDLALDVLKNILDGQSFEKIMKK